MRLKDNKRAIITVCIFVYVWVCMSVFIHLGVNIAYLDIKTWPVLLCLNLYKSRPKPVEPVTDLQ